MNALANIKRPEERPTQVRATEESLVTDSRAGMTPSQMVERKLIGLLRGTSLPVSQLMTAAVRRGLS